jgi:hypothetical protein
MSGRELALSHPADFALTVVANRVSHCTAIGVPPYLAMSALQCPPGASKFCNSTDTKPCRAAVAK